MSSRPAWRGLLLALVAAALGGLVYLNALHNPFVYDDYRMIVDNGTIETLTAPRTIALHEATRPVINFSYAIDHALWGAAPFGYHLTGVLLHAVNVVLLFLVAYHLARDRKPDADGRRAFVAAFAAAALFAVHPLMTEAVGYISARPDVLGGMLFLLAFLAGRRWMLGGAVGWWLLTVSLWVAALLSKETAIVLPAALFCYERLVLDSSAATRQRLFRRLYAPLFGLALLAGIVRLAVFRYVEHTAGVAFDTGSLVEQAAVMWRYAGLLFMLGDQTIYHALPPMSGLLTLSAIVPLLALVLAVALAWRWRRGDPMMRFGVLWFVLLLAPAAALVLIDQSDPMAEHRVYLASCGIFLAAGSAAVWCGARLSRVSARLSVLGGMAFAVLVLSLGARTVLRNVVWANPVTLWAEAVANAPDRWLPRAALAEALHEAGQRDDAIAEYRTAVALNPRDEMGYMNLAVCLAESGRKDQAAATLDALRRRNPQSPIVSIGLGAVAMVAGESDRARVYLLRTLDANPRNVMALQMLALLEERAGHPAEALRRCEEVQPLLPGSLSTEDCIRRNRSRLVDK